MATPDEIRHLIPINSLGPDNLNDLATKTKVETLKKGKELFDEGDTDDFAIYLLSGEVALTSESKAERLIVGGTDAALYALAQLKPRQYCGTAKSEVIFVRVDSKLLDRLITMEQAAQAGGIEVEEIGEDTDAAWMVQLLRSDTFQRLPPSNFNALLQKFAPLQVKAGQIIIKQGDPGDYYYLIHSGRANVARKAADGKVAMVGELKDGDGFGEEALLSGAPRNATVIMRTEGVLLQLAKKDFDELLREPLVKWVGGAQARSLVESGGVLLDVRLPDEFSSGSLKGAVNLPLSQLRQKADTLDRAHPYISFCQSGSRSCAAAFLLTQRGFDVYVLRGGLGTITA